MMACAHPLASRILVGSAFVVTALFVATPASSQEPSRLERLAGLCRDEQGAAVGAYGGRVLWTEDGQLSGMLMRDKAAEDAGALKGEKARGGFAPSSITVPRQTPEANGDGFVVRTKAVLASADGGKLASADLACTVFDAAAKRPDPGATGRG
jgi:hypothetical protein